MHKKVVIGVVLLVLVGTGVFTANRWFGAKQEGIKATGTIEITRADIAPKVAGYVTELTINQGDRVRNGQVIARVSRPDLDAQLLRDEAALQKAEAQLADMVKGARVQERTESVAAVAAAQAQYDKAVSDFSRYQDLYRQGAISAQQFDVVRANIETTQSALVAARARFSLVDEGQRPDTIAAQQKEVARSKAVLEISKTMAQDTVISSPIDGLVLTKNFERGEFVNIGAAIATIGNMEDCWVKIYVASSQLGLITLGQPASVKVDSFPGRIFSGEIKEISQNAEFTPRQSITERERANLVFAVKIKVDNPEGVLKPGMPADVVLQ